MTWTVTAYRVLEAVVHSAQHFALFVPQTSRAEVQAVNPPPKRRRILDPSAIVPVPVYSNKVKLCSLASWSKFFWLCLQIKLCALHHLNILCFQVNSSLQLKPMAAVFTEKEKTGKTECLVCSVSNSAAGDFSCCEVDCFCLWSDDCADDSLWSEFSSRGTTADFITLSDSEEDGADCLENKEQKEL